MSDEPNSPLPSGRTFAEYWPNIAEGIRRDGFTCAEASEGLRRWAASGLLDVGAMLRREQDEREKAT